MDTASVKCGLARGECNKHSTQVCFHPRKILQKSFHHERTLSKMHPFWFIFTKRERKHRQTKKAVSSAVFVRFLITTNLPTRFTETLRYLDELVKQTTANLLYYCMCFPWKKFEHYIYYIFDKLIKLEQTTSIQKSFFGIICGISRII